MMSSVLGLGSPVFGLLSSVLGFQFSAFGLQFENSLFLMIGLIAIGAFIFLNRNILRGKERKVIVLLRVLAIASLFAILAMPYMVKEEEITQETTSVIAIDDMTDSMSICQSSLASEAASGINDRTGGLAKVDTLNISTSNRTAIGDFIYQGIVGSSMRNNVIILASDGNNNYGADPLDVATFAAGADTRIYSILPDVLGREVYVSGIIGAEKTPVNSKYTGKVVIESLGGEISYHLKISIDDLAILDTDIIQSLPKKELSFEHVFNGRGTHNITAEITPQGIDTFSENNKFNKVVNVIERPGVLLVTQSSSSPLQQVLEEVYDVETSMIVPENLAPYGAVVMDDEPAAAIMDLDEFRGFLNDGGGLIVVGGNNSYGEGDYYESSFENLLPVKSVESPSKKGEKINVVILMDISGSTGNAMGGETKIDVEKAIAVNMVRDLSKTTDIGVAAFNSDSFLIQSIRKTDDTSLLEDKISRLQFGGGTYVMTGLIRAGDMLKSVQGSKYIVLISDGVTNYPVQAFEKAVSLAGEGIVIHTIGVGFDTDETFMMGLATRGKGVYFRPSETERVNIIIGGLEESEEQEGFNMVITDAHHFITEGLDISNVSIKNFDEVTAKSSAQVLATTQGLKPILAVWRFGLGRVASLMVDDGEDWARKLYTSGNSMLVSSTVNWAIGDPERKKDMRIDCVDTAVGEETTVSVVSKSNYPQVYMDGEGVELTRLDESSYYFTYYPAEPGFVNVVSPGYSCSMAVNYPEEYSKLGVNTELLTAMANITGGKVYFSDQAWSLVDEIAEYTIAESTGVAVKRINMELWFAMAALFFFLADIVARRVREIRQNRPAAERRKEKKV